MQRHKSLMYIPKPVASNCVSKSVSVKLAMALCGHESNFQMHRSMSSFIVAYSEMWTYVLKTRTCVLVTCFLADNSVRFFLHRMQAMTISGACILAINIPIILISMYYWCAGGSERSDHEPREFVSSLNNGIKILGGLDDWANFVFWGIVLIGCVRQLLR